MLTRLYAHNFRCYQNFSLDLIDPQTALVFGKNGSGRSTTLHVLYLFQQITRGTTKLKNVVASTDFCLFSEPGEATKALQMRFELDMKVKGRKYAYALALELPEGFREVRVAEESLSVGGRSVFTRQLAQVKLGDGGVSFNVDWHIVALPVINERSSDNPITVVRDFLASMILLAPVPRDMTGYSDEPEPHIDITAKNIASTLRSLLEQKPAAYSLLDMYIRERLADFSSLEFIDRRESGRQMVIKYDQINALDFSVLSRGEKCFILAALVLTIHEKIGPVFCFWDEPDNHLALSEINQFTAGMRKLGSKGEGQILITSHHPEAIRAFSDENTFVFVRPNRHTPTQPRLLSSFQYSGSLIDALIADELIG